MVKIKNPIDKDLNLAFKGEDYVIEAGVSKEFEADVAAQFVLIYGFLSIEGSDKAKDKVVEEAAKATKKTTKKATKKVAKKDEEESDDNE